MVVKHVSYIKGGIHGKGIEKKDPEASIWAEER